MSTLRRRTRDRLALRHVFAPRKRATLVRWRSQPPGSAGAARRTAHHAGEVNRHAH